VKLLSLFTNTDGQDNIHSYFLRSEPAIDVRLGLSSSDTRIAGFESVLISLPFSVIQSRDSSVNIASGYGLNDQEAGFRVPVESGIFTSPSRPDRLWGPLNLLSNGYLGQENVDLYIHSPTRLHIVVLN
jgi:hypothetical protein